jgi:hypothetical protein
MPSAIAGAPDRRPRLLFAILLGVSLLVILPAAPARAQTVITDCSDSQAIHDALENGGAFIFDCGPGAVVDLSTGDPISILAGTVTTVEGNGVTFDGGQQGFIFVITGAGSSLTLDRVTLTRGGNISHLMPEPDLEFSAQTFACGGAIFMIESSVSVTNSTFTNNVLDISLTATSTGGSLNATAIAQGAAICNLRGTLSLANTTFSDNHALATAHGTAAGEATVTASAQGAAIFSDGGDVEIFNSTFSNNRVVASATAHADDQASASAEATAAAFHAFDSLANTNLNNATIADSQADTEVEATSINGGRSISEHTDGTAIANDGGTFRIFSTMLADPVACTGDIGSAGFNLTIDDGCGLNEATDLIVSDVRLGSLQDNGGDTLTHLPASDSPAVDQGSCPSLTTDQRGEPRPVDRLPANPADGCDVGAVEFQGIAGESFELRNSTLASYPGFTRLSAGDPVYLRFSLEDGASIDDLTALVQPIACSSGAPIGSATTAQLVGGIRSFEGAGYYQLIWRTHVSWANTCKQLVLTFSDGSAVRFNMRFTTNR